MSETTYESLSSVLCSPAYKKHLEDKYLKATETAKADYARTVEGFYSRFMQGMGLDIGYKGYGAYADPVLPTAIGIDLEYPGYDGVKLPFPTESQDFVYASHVLEHLPYPIECIQEWFRVLKVGGHLIIAVPHQYLFEKKLQPPSLWDKTHRYFFTPGKVLETIEKTLKFNTYRVVHLCERDDAFDYSKPPGVQAETRTERYEIELVLKKIQAPQWEIAA